MQSKIFILYNDLVHVLINVLRRMGCPWHVAWISSPFKCIRLVKKYENMKLVQLNIL